MDPHILQHPFRNLLCSLKNSWSSAKGLPPEVLTGLNGAILLAHPIRNSWCSVATPLADRAMKSPTERCQIIWSLTVLEDGQDNNPSKIQVVSDVLSTCSKSDTTQNSGAATGRTRSCQLYHSFWKFYLTSLHLRFVICEMRIMTIS